MNKSLKKRGVVHFPARDCSVVSKEMKLDAELANVSLNSMLTAVNTSAMWQKQNLQSSFN